MNTATVNRPWDVAEVETTVPTDVDAVEAALGHTDSALSSGWVCTLTIECGTIVCACQ